MNRVILVLSLVLAPAFSDASNCTVKQGGDGSVPMDAIVAQNMPSRSDTDVNGAKIMIHQLKLPAEFPPTNAKRSTDYTFRAVLSGPDLDQVGLVVYQGGNIDPIWKAMGAFDSEGKVLMLFQDFRSKKYPLIFELKCVR